MQTSSQSPLTAAARAVVAIALVLPTAVTWLYFIALDGAPKWQQQAAFAVGKGIQFALPILCIWWMQRRVLKISAPSGRGLIAGALFGVAVGAAIVGLYFANFKPAGAFEFAAEAVRTKVHALGGESLPAYIALAVFYSAIHSLLEEYYWRWFVFGQLARDWRLVAAILVSAVAFCAHHVLVLEHYFGWASPLTWLFVGGVFVGGAFWAWLYWHSRSLYGPWLSHALVDAAIFLIGYDIVG